MKSIDLTITLATYNEEANIEKCLKAAKKLTDKIIIVDGSSNDRTKEIAKKMGAKVYLTTNKPNFHINKKMANDKARTSWVLQLDADEFVTDDLAKEINSLLESKYFGEDRWQSPFKQKLASILPFMIEKPQRLNRPAAAYYIPRKNYFLGRYLTHTGQYPDPVIRLFQPKFAYLPAKDVHEQMVVNGTVGWLKNDLDHWATPHFNRYITRENRYSSFAASLLKDNGVRPGLGTFISFMILKPLSTFVSLFVRYRGFQDGFPGFVFSLFSALHHNLTYMKLWELNKD